MNALSPHDDAAWRKKAGLKVPKKKRADDDDALCQHGISKQDCNECKVGQQLCPTSRAVSRRSTLR